VKSVLISIQPKWCELIALGKKTVEVRKTRPKIDTPFKCYIYETKGKTDLPTFIDEDGHEIYQGRGQVIGEFVCDWIESTPLWRLKGNTGFLAKRTEREEKLPQMACLSLDEIYRYILNENKLIYGWHIKDLVIYDKPKELSEFSRHDNSYDNCFGWAFEDRAKSVPITRPPQSWCYVEKGGAE
jgi:predicted transcriptional regulator